MQCPTDGQRGLVGAPVCPDQMMDTPKAMAVNIIDISSNQDKGFKEKEEADCDGNGHRNDCKDEASSDLHFCIPAAVRFLGKAP